MEKSLSASQSSMCMSYPRSSHLLQGRTSTAYPPPASGNTSPADIALQLRRMKRRLFLELVNSSGSGGDENSCSSTSDGNSRSEENGFPSYHHRRPSNASVGSTKMVAPRSRLSRTDSDISGLTFSSRSLDNSVVSDENGEI
jgi:hypothetical protein